jgi:hypothetical protein
MDADVVAFLEFRKSWDRTSAQWDAVLQALRNGACVDTRTSTGFTLLHLACSCAPEAIVRTLLVELGANPSIETCRGWRPMHYAAYMNRLGICKLLPRTDLKVRVRGEQEHWFTPLGLVIATAEDPYEPEELARWCADQPECPLDDTYYTYFVAEVAATSLPYIAVAKEHRRRWSPLRAAFVGAVVSFKSV